MLGEVCTNILPPFFIRNQKTATDQPEQRRWWTVWIESNNGKNRREMKWIETTITTIHNCKLSTLCFHTFKSTCYWPRYIVKELSLGEIDTLCSICLENVGMWQQDHRAENWKRKMPIKIVLCSSKVEIMEHIKLLETVWLWVKVRISMYKSKGRPQITCPKFRREMRSKWQVWNYSWQRLLIEVFPSNVTVHTQSLQL